MFDEHKNEYARRHHGAPASPGHFARHGATARAGSTPMKTKLTNLLSISLLVTLSACTVTSYRSPAGERFTRASLGTTAAVSELTVTGDTNGVRSLSLKGYSSDQAQALSAVTSAAVTAALQSVKPAP